MKILGLESSAKSASVALVEDGKILARSYQNSGLTHSRTLLPMAETMLHNCDLSMDDIGAVAVAVGPGSFTGLRIGISAAKGLAWAKEIPCAGISTLEAMAQNLAHLDNTLIVCAMDARRKQVYNALFLAEGGSLRRICEDRAIALSDVAEELKGLSYPKIVIGDGALLCYNYLQDAGIPCTLAPEHLRMQDAVGVCLCAETAVKEEKLLSSADLQPIYLRLSQAERERLQKEKSDS